MSGTSDSRNLGAKLKTLLDPLAKPRIDMSGEVDGRTHGQRMHDALEDVCDRQLRAGEVPDAGGVPATVIVTIDLDDLVKRVGSGRTGDGTLMPTAKMLSWPTTPTSSPPCSPQRVRCWIWPEPADRQPNPNHGVIARDGGCSFPGCAHPPQYCESHHIREWVDGGLTNLNNLTLLCAYHSMLRTDLEACM